MAVARNSLHARVAVATTIWCMLSSHVFGFAGGTGEPNDPFLVATPEHLISIGSDPRLLDKCYRLVNDIDLAPTQADGRVFTGAVMAADISSDRGFQGMGFVGRFDGGGYAIRHLTIQGGTGSFLGLFGALGRHSEVTNLSITDANIVGERDGAYVGGLAGMNEGYVTGCYVRGNMRGDYSVGSVVGYNAKHGTVIRCSATGMTQGDGRAEVAGGLVGYNEGIIAKCWVHGCDVVCSRGGMDYLGGLVGLNSGSIRSCFVDGKVNGEYCLGGIVGSNEGLLSSSYARVAIQSRELSQFLGGLTGQNEGVIINCYASGTILNQSIEDSYRGGLIGWRSERARIINSFWDTEIGGIYVSDGGTGLTTARMMDPEVYSLNGWAADPNWTIDPGEDYPRLAWEATSGQPIPLPKVDGFNGSGTSDDPYLIATPEQLARIGTASILWSKTFVLVSDVNLGGVDFRPMGICPGTDFSGTFDGGKHIVSHLTIDTREFRGHHTKFGGPG